jgi:hypothetical protein
MESVGEIFKGKQIQGKGRVVFKYLVTGYGGRGEKARLK